MASDDHVPEGEIGVWSGATNSLQDYPSRIEIFDGTSCCALSLARARPRHPNDRDRKMPAAAVCDVVDRVAPICARKQDSFSQAGQDGSMLVLANGQHDHVRVIEWRASSAS